MSWMEYRDYKMTCGIRRLCSMTWVLLICLALVPTPPGSGAMELKSMEDQCIMSFVIPKDKVKSSCDIEDRVMRRLHAMEAKVSIVHGLFQFFFYSTLSDIPDGKSIRFSMSVCMCVFNCLCFQWFLSENRYPLLVDRSNSNLVER